MFTQTCLSQRCRLTIGIHDEENNPLANDIVMRCQHKVYTNEHTIAPMPYLDIGYQF